MENEQCRINETQIQSGYQLSRNKNTVCVRYISKISIINTNGTCVYAGNKTWQCNTNRNVHKFIRNLLHSELPGKNKAGTVIARAITV
jgi:hypothetical protein